MVTKPDTIESSRKPDTTHSPGEETVVKEVLGIGQKLLDEPGQHNAFWGISLTTTISDRDIALYSNWIMKYCRHCPILIDDFEFRHNYEVLDYHNDPEKHEKALKKVLGNGLNLAGRITAVVAGLQYPHKAITDRTDHRGHGIWVKRSSEEPVLQKSDGVLEKFKNAYKEDDIFRQDVDQQVIRGMGKRIDLWRPSVSHVDYEAGLKSLADFVLEEAAITIDYVERGYSVELHHGRPIEVVVNLYDRGTNKYPQLREMLALKAEYGHIDFGVQKI